MPIKSGSRCWIVSRRSSHIAPARGSPFQRWHFRAQQRWPRTCQSFILVSHQTIHLPSPDVQCCKFCRALLTLLGGCAGDRMARIRSTATTGLGKVPPVQPSLAHTSITAPASALTSQRCIHVMSQPASRSPLHVVVILRFAPPAPTNNL